MFDIFCNKMLERRGLSWPISASIAQDWLDRQNPWQPGRGSGDHSHQWVRLLEPRAKVGSGEALLVKVGFQGHGPLWWGVPLPFHSKPSVRVEKNQNG